MAQEDKTKEELEMLDSERKQMEVALRENERLWSATFDAISDSVCLIDSDGKILKCNQATERLLGKPAGELNGQFCYKVVHGLSQPIPDCPIEQMKKTKRRESKILQLGDRWLEVITDPILDKDQRVLVAVHIIHDITELKQAEEALRESEERYRIQFEQTMGALFLADTQTGIILECNRAARELIGREKSEMVGQHQRILHPSEELDGKFSKSFEQHITGETLVETRVIKKSGEIRDVEIRASVFDLKGKKVILAIFHDITERKKREEQIRSAAEEWRMTFDSITDLISIIDRDFKLIRVNKAFANTFGLEFKEAIGKTCYKVVHGAGESHPDCPYKKTLITQKPITVEFFDTFLNRHFEVSISPLFNNNGDMTSAVHLMRDITERKKLEKEERENVHELEVFYKASVGREERILELKKEIEQLKKELGK